MIISSNMLGALIVMATVLVALAPVVLIVLWIRDRKGGKLW